MKPISVESTQYIKTNVTQVVAGVFQDILSLSIAFAFIAYGTATPGPTTTWYAGGWETNPTSSPPYVAQCNIGPLGVVALSAGNYSVWLKITAGSETPVLQVPGNLVVV